MNRHRQYINVFGSEFENLSPANDDPSHGGGDGGGGDMSNRMTRIETIAANQEKLLDDMRQDVRGIRGDIHGLERRIVDKMDENHKWVIGLIVSSILVPLFIALVTK